MSWTAHDDLAEAAAVALTDDGALDGITPPLTAPDPLDFGDIAEILTRINGRTITRAVVDDSEWTAAAAASGMPRPAAEFLLTMFAASRDGEFNVTHPALEATIGRPAMTVHEVLAAAVRLR